MPHLKVKPFDTKEFDRLDRIEFRGIDSSDKRREVILFRDDRDAFDIIKREREFLIKPNKITKSSKTDDLKKKLNYLAEVLKLDIINSNTNIRATKVEVKSQFLKDIEFFYNFKSDFKKIKLEIGFGSGRHLLYRAKSEPDTLFIGIEIHTPSINQLLKQINLQKLHNIYVLNYDGRLLLEMLKSNILDKIYVHFPVPWDKKPHRRVINSSFIQQALRTLKKGSDLELRTDSLNYYRYSLKLFSDLNRARFKVDKNIDIDVVSKYEDRWRRMNKDIYTINLFSLEESKEMELRVDFSSREISRVNYEKIPKEPIVKGDFFLHFGKIFKDVNSKERALIEVSFGDFQMPERKFLYIEGDRYSYLPTNPVKSLANYKAHKLIKEVLNEE